MELQWAPAFAQTGGWGKGAVVTSRGPDLSFERGPSEESDFPGLCSVIQTKRLL
jgi:hypothetical protein